MSVYNRSSGGGGHYLAGLLALHDLEDGFFEGVVDKGRGCGLHVLLHQRAGQRGRSEQRGRLVYMDTTMVDI